MASGLHGTSKWLLKPVKDASGPCIPGELWRTLRADCGFRWKCSLYGVIFSLYFSGNKIFSGLGVRSDETLFSGVFSSWFSDLLFEALFRDRRTGWSSRTPRNSKETQKSPTEKDRPVCGSLTWISFLELLACDLHRIIFNQSNARDFPKISLLILTNRNCRIYNGPIRMLNTDQPSKVETTRFWNIFMVFIRTLMWMHG